MKNKKHKCLNCEKTPLDKDTVAINKKLRGSKVDSFYCVSCLADYFGVEPHEIMEKIEQFKEDGCVLFQ